MVTAMLVYDSMEASLCLHDRDDVNPHIQGFQHSELDFITCGCMSPSRFSCAASTFADGGASQPKAAASAGDAYPSSSDVLADTNHASPWCRTYRDVLKP